jgi:hypothetical protein
LESVADSTQFIAMQIGDAGGVPLQVDEADEGDDQEGDANEGEGEGEEGEDTTSSAVIPATDDVNILDYDPFYF